MNADKPESIAQDKRLDAKGKRAKAGGHQVTAPFNENPYDMFHPSNLNNARCLTPQAFEYYVGSHIRAGETATPLVSHHMSAIMSLLMLSRNPQSTYTDMDREERQCGEDLPTMTHERVNLRFTPEELAAYKLRESECGEAPNVDFANMETATQADLERFQDADQDPDKSGPGKKGSKYNQIICLCSHLGLHGFRSMAPEKVHQLSREGLPAITYRMKLKGSLNPNAPQRPFKDHFEVFRQFL